VNALSNLLEALRLVIKGCACAGDCKLCYINREEATQALDRWREFDRLYNLAVICRRCGALADPDNHACEE
jgi:hypothetical protein